MADPLYLSLWFPSFQTIEIMPRLTSVLRQFPFSTTRPGIGYVSVHPVDWGQPTVVERRFRPGLDVEQAIAIAGEFVHEDYAYVFEIAWDLWVLADDERRLELGPQTVKFIAHGTGFDEGIYQQAGHIQVDLGLDSPFLYEDVQLDSGAETRMRSNVQKLITFTNAVEKNCGITGRVLWSDSEEDLALKLVDLLQRVH